MDGGIVEDAAMQALYDKLIDHPHGMYSPLKGAVGKRFIKMFAAELTKVRAREINSERALMFPAVILRRVPGVTRAKAIRKWLMRRMDSWMKGMMAELVQDTVNTSERGAGGGNPAADEESLARKYHSMVIYGRLRAGVRGLTSRDGRGVMGMEDIDQKTKLPVIEVLKGKHPNMAIPIPGKGKAFEEYREMACHIELDCTEENVQDIAGKLYGGAGPSSVDALALKNGFSTMELGRRYSGRN